MKYKIGDIVRLVRYNSIQRVIICDIKVTYLDPVYRIKFIDKNGNMSLPFTDYVTIEILDNQSELDKNFLREEKLKRILNG
jgi:hypothetical protein